MCESQWLRKVDADTSVRLIALASTLLISAGCALNAQSDRAVKSGIPLPPLQLASHVDEVNVRVSCASICEVRGIPDSWSLSISPQGEDYAMSIRPTVAAHSNHDLIAVRFVLGSRGMMSDCMDVDAKVAYVNESGAHIDCAHYDLRAGWQSSRCRQ